MRIMFAFIARIFEVFFFFFFNIGKIPQFKSSNTRDLARGFVRFRAHDGSKRNIPEYDEHCPEYDGLGRTEFRYMVGNFRL